MPGFRTALEGALAAFFGAGFLASYGSFFEAVSRSSILKSSSDVSYTIILSLPSDDFSTVSLDFAAGAVFTDFLPLAPTAALAADLALGGVSGFYTKSSGISSSDFAIVSASFFKSKS